MNNSFRFGGILYIAAIDGPFLLKHKHLLYDIKFTFYESKQKSLLSTMSLISSKMDLKEFCEKNNVDDLATAENAPIDMAKV